MDLYFRFSFDNLCAREKVKLDEHHPKVMVY